MTPILPPILHHSFILLFPPSSRSVFYPPFQRLFTVDSALGKSGRGLILKAERRHVGYQGPELQGNQGTSSGGYVQTASKRKKQKKEETFLIRFEHFRLVKMCFSSATGIFGCSHRLCM